ncbi:hypothetical protein Tco_1301449 [Tanacetum coccineum]
MGYTYSRYAQKGGMIVVLNDNNELIPSRTVTGWRVCIDYRKLNDATQKDHFPLFIDQMLERLCGNEYYCFLDGFSGFFQIPIAPEDQEKTTFTCPYGTFAYRRMPFGLYKCSLDGGNPPCAKIGKNSHLNVRRLLEGKSMNLDSIGLESLKKAKRLCDECRCIAKDPGNNHHEIKKPIHEHNELNEITRKEEHMKTPESTKKEPRDGMTQGFGEIKISKQETRNMEIIDKNGISFKVNGQRLKKYHDEHINEEEKEMVELDNGPHENEKSMNIGGELLYLEILKCWSLETSRVLYKVEDIATCLVKYVKFWDDWEVDRYGNANLDYYSEDQYAVSIKEDTAYPCLHSPKTTKGKKINTPYPEKLNTPYSRYGINIIFWKISSVVPTPRNPQYAVSIPWIRRIQPTSRPYK